jgi:hypothetical protein
MSCRRIRIRPSPAGAVSVSSSCGGVCDLRDVLLVVFEESTDGDDLVVAASLHLTIDVQ